MKSAIHSIVLVLVLVLPVSSAACGGKAQTPSAPAPVRAVLVLDLYRPEGAPVRQLTVADLEPLITLVRQRGGDLAVGKVSSNSGEPLLRLHVEDPPMKPAPTGNALSDRQASDTFNVDMQAWAAKSDPSVASFESQLGVVLALGASAAGASPWTELRTAGLFLKEPTATSPHNWLIFVSEREFFVSKCLDINQERTVDPGH